MVLTQYICLRTSNSQFIKAAANMNCVKNQTNFDLFYGLTEQ
jgi:hypothetical protein